MGNAGCFCAGALTSAGAMLLFGPNGRRKVSLPYVDSKNKRVLLISNSRLRGMGYLDHVEQIILDFLGPLSPEAYVLFVPYAQTDCDGFSRETRRRFGDLGYKLHSLHEYQSVAARHRAVMNAACIFVGGGNSFRLLKALSADPHILSLIHKRVNSGELWYIGSSAGACLASPTIRTSNDMAIVSPPSLAGLCLVPFQINTHYIDGDREVVYHTGEPRELKLTEFLEENTIPVVALRETASIFVQGETAVLLGPSRKSFDIPWEGAQVRRRNELGGNLELITGDSLTFLMRPVSTTSQGGTAMGGVADGTWVLHMLDTNEYGLRQDLRNVSIARIDPRVGPDFSPRIDPRTGSDFSPRIDPRIGSDFIPRDVLRY